MGTLERRETLTHRIGSSGRLSVKTITGTLRIRGIEGEDARVTVDYRIRAADQASAERALDSGRVNVDRGTGTLEIETPELRLNTGLAWLFGGARVYADISVEVPWGARVRLETMSGSIEAQTLVGDQKYRTVSGDVRLWNLGGLVEAGTISGGITLDGGTELRLRANTISGGIRARAGVFHSLSLNTTSGGMRISGGLAREGDFRAESISGGVELATPSGFTAELRTVSGSIQSEVAHRLEGSRGFWRAIVGDGSARVRVNSTSGSLQIRAASPGESRPSWVVPPAPVAPPPPGAPGAPQPPVPPAAPAGPGDSAEDAPSGEPGEAAEGEDTAVEASETWNPAESPDEAAEAGEGGADTDEMAVLQSLERGEIDVDEAAARLERMRSGGNVR
jgi:DUF4097 and DUF4098 domain-containing protein YvlB